MDPNFFSRWWIFVCSDQDKNDKNPVWLRRKVGGEKSEVDSAKASTQALTPRVIPDPK